MTGHTMRTMKEVANFQFRWLRAVNAAIAAGTRIYKLDDPNDPGERMTGLDAQVAIACTRWIIDLSMIFFRTHEHFAEDCGVTPNGIKKAVDRLVACGFLVKVPASKAKKKKKLTGRPAQHYRPDIPEAFSNGGKGKMVVYFTNSGRGKVGDFPSQSGGEVVEALSPTAVGELSHTTVGAISREESREGADAPSGARRPAPYRPCPIIDPENPFNDDPEPLTGDDDE